LFCGCKYKKMDSKSDNLYDFNRVFALKVIQCALIAN
jgi:hypothetical protein